MMSPPKGLFLPHNRLAKIIGVADGHEFEVLVARAEEEVERVRPKVEAGLGRAVAHLVEQCSQPEDVVFSEARGVALAASHVVEDASVVGQTEIAEVAAGVAELMQALFASGVWHSEAIEVHVEALKLLTSGSPTPRETRRMLQNLADARSAVGTLPERSRTG